MPNISLIYPEKILNIPSQKMLDVMNFAYNKMDAPTSKVLAVSWKVGNFSSDGGFTGKPFNTYKVLLSQEKIESIITQTGDWIDQAVIEKGEPEGYKEFGVKNSELNNLRQYLEGGADASMQLAIGPDIRLIYIAQTDGMTTEPDYLTLVLHELYHALQKDIGIETYIDLTENNPESNARWLSEGAAEYFAEKTYQELNKSYSGSNKFLSEALGSYLEDNSTALINGAAIASRGAAALSLMVQKGLLQENLILDGSLFHNSTTETDYSDANPHILDAKKNWSKIIVDNENYGFSTEALEGGVLNTDDTPVVPKVVDTKSLDKGTLNTGDTPVVAKVIDADGNLWDSTIDVGDGTFILAQEAQLYRAYFGAMGRLPDEAGYNWWLAELKLDRATLESMATGFVDSDEFKSLADTDNSGVTSNEEFILHMYNGVFGRAPDQAGFAWWLGELDTQATTQPYAFISMTQSNEYVELTIETVADMVFL